MILSGFEIREIMEKIFLDGVLQKYREHMAKEKKRRISCNQPHDLKYYIDTDRENKEFSAGVEKSLVALLSISETEAEKDHHRRVDFTTIRCAGDKTVRVYADHVQKASAAVFGVKSDGSLSWKIARSTILWTKDAVHELQVYADWFTTARYNTFIGMLAKCEERASSTIRLSKTSADRSPRIFKALKVPSCAAEVLKLDRQLRGDRRQSVLKCPCGGRPRISRPPRGPIRAISVRKDPRDVALELVRRHDIKEMTSRMKRTFWLREEDILLVHWRDGFDTESERESDEEGDESETTDTSDSEEEETVDEK